MIRRHPLVASRWRSAAARCRLVAVCALLLVPAGRARANGLELLPGGTRSVARGGAVAARPEDPMAMIHNPAGLAFMPDDQFMLDVDIALHDMCVDLYGYYGWGIYDADADSQFGDPLEVELDDDDRPVIGATYATTPLPEVCNTGPVGPLPLIAWAGHLTDDLTLGIGMPAPTIVAAVQYGGADGSIQRGELGLPTPTRYQLVRQQVDFALAPAASIAYRVLPELSLGATLQVAMLSATSRAIAGATTGTQPSKDWLLDAEARDFFIPAVTVSVHARPVRALDLMAGFRWVDGFDGSGDAVFETNTFYDEDAESGPVPFKNDEVGLSPIEIPLPWAFTAGVRYAGLLSEDDPDDGKPAWDPMGRELWDVEVDFTYNLNDRASDTVVEISDENVTVITRDATGDGDRQTASRDEVAGLNTDRELLDSIAVRLGGSYSVLPRTLALHAGGFYESRGADPAYAHVESFAFARVGVGVGVMVRLGDFDLTAAYSHIFQETIEVAPPPHELAEDYDRDDPTRGFDKRVGGTLEADGTRSGGYVLEDPDAPDPEDADAVASYRQSTATGAQARGERVVNAGKYTAAFDVISIGASYHF
jgi:hypothetical protein